MLLRFFTHKLLMMAIVFLPTYASAQPTNIQQAIERSAFPPHPWINGRPAHESFADWILDSEWATGTPLGGIAAGEDGMVDGTIAGVKRFIECFEPRLIAPICEFCAPLRFKPHWRGPTSCPDEWNNGFVFAYWWPEAQVEVSDFGISAFNPVVHGDSEREKMLIHRVLAEQARVGLGTLGQSVDLYIRKMGTQTDQEVALQRSTPNIGQTAYEGYLPGDQNLHLEAHVYQTNVGLASSEKRNPRKGRMDFRYRKNKLGICEPRPFWYNGYIKGNKECFYNTLREKTSPTHMWTEELEFAPYWRIPELSKDLHEDLYEHAVPIKIDGDIQGLTVDFTYPTTRSCASYRAAKWPDLVVGNVQDHTGKTSTVTYGQLESMLGIVPNEWEKGDRLCYPGGGDLMPITGTIAGHFNPLVSAAYLSRRALFLSSRRGPNQTFKFSDLSDKLQRLSPNASDCFMMDEINQTNENLFPKIQTGDSIRYAYWNMRIACVCQYRGTYPLPLMGTDASWFYALPFGEGCHPWRYTSLAEGDAEHAGKIGINMPIAASVSSWPNMPKGPYDTDYTRAARQLYPFARKKSQ